MSESYEKQWWMRYFDVKIQSESTSKYQNRSIAMFKQNIFTRTIYVFQSNCIDNGNKWNEPGYGWGIWKKLP